MVDVAAWLSANWQAVVSLFSAGIAVLSLWINWRLSGASREHLVNEEIRKAFKEMTGEEPNVLFHAVLDGYEDVKDPRVIDLLLRIRELQRSSRLYLSKKAGTADMRTQGS